MTGITILNIEIPPAVYIPVFYFLWVSVFMLLKTFVYRNIQKFAGRTVTQLDDLFLSSADLPLTLLVFVSGIFVLENIFQFGLDSELLTIVNVVFKATAILAIIIFCDKFFNGLIDNYKSRASILQTSGNMIRIIIRSVVLGLGVLIILDNFGVSIAPLLASLGIGSLAIALALQPTLENFFSGIQLVVDKPIVVGQFIKLESGEEGYVHKIGWRSTWIRMLANNVVVMPNKAIVNSKIINYYYPKTEMSTLVQVGVHYESDLAHVERVTIEVAREVLGRVQGGVGEFDPFIRYHTFNDFSIDFTVILRVKEFVDNYLIKHEFVKALHKRYNEEGIVIPYPIRTLDWNPASQAVKVAKQDN